ncbi:MAG TPA: hydroxyacid dehydrogenase [Anaerolineales bacterium]|nr:hydroxyacid dehydrogenase [Anaerolineales bacterium]
MKILIASKIDPASIEKLKENHEVVCAFGADKETLKTAIQGCDVLIFRSGVDISAEVMAASPSLKLLIRGGSGVDNLDMNYVNQHDLRLVRIPGPGAKAVAELSFALMLALARKVVEADRLTRQGHWAKSEMTGYLLTGKVLGVVGAGNIGFLVAHMGAAWGMKVLACVEHATPERMEEFERAGIQLTTCEQVLAESDFVSVHVPLKPDTRNFIDAEELALMKPNAYLVNLARGGVVNEAALHQALAEGRLGGAALDVHQAEGEGKISPLAEFKNVILTPHIGASTFDSQKEIGAIILQTMESFMAEPVLAGSVQTGSAQV